MVIKMILIGLGSNLTTDEFATSKEILEAAMDMLAQRGVEILKRSAFYETEPVPKSDQPWFCNAVVSVETKMGAIDLLKLLHDIEHDLGRVRRKRWEARIIDLDLLSYNDEIFPSRDEWESEAQNINPEHAIIPHGRLHERDFVLIPMMDICPDWQHPVLGKTTEKMLAGQQSAGIVRKML
ncbi:2-amino-4-hydroxy-6-hydroxymethyldihydropteridine diphosphokinase [Pseudemcibacter aquimaris]|uniref:2-amino-4-hydroxy-6- hydroxymethyldihydropteridine diphosphokinase n=1 Tax=Pseudemcibacter aquimaris TaxID=2857064 RepID=UPI002013AB8F|nr:2-amino-4-hydroxy-6-hydroxymethyldihydropteridine diphosphokinase [Pseudemcibacter aquimaris]MCC3860655.1 2-amino-4-hydroxy-6-hydroxymethyldihydropteridine diphosphokinase [Pseudemcibacter aquimaris]WDU59474.1 2-amino-4-hydroxy-6-hydroxymethyldihydropteridine diphosphokinase [Pseudemcibacter aquimaris]